MNTFGNIFKVTTYGESHGAAVGGIIDGCPSGVEIDLSFIQSELNRRKPGQSSITTPRKEDDTIEITSGVFEGVSTGTPISFIVRNKNQHSSDYNNLKNVFRPSHADYTYTEKYGHRDHRGGGRSSARETIARVAAGAIAKCLLKSLGISINAYVSQVGEIKLNKSYKELDLSLTESNIIRCPDSETAQVMIQEIEKVRSEKDSVGGVISAVAQGVPVGLGEPVFNKLHADLGASMLGINAVKGFEYGSGFAAASMRGSQHNDRFKQKEGKVETDTNFSGGIQGGISNGEDIYWNVAFKPIATLLVEQETITKEGETVVLTPKGRHDPCVLPRAVPIVEAMAALVFADHYLMNRYSRM